MLNDTENTISHPKALRRSPSANSVSSATSLQSVNSTSTAKKSRSLSIHKAAFRFDSHISMLIIKRGNFARLQSLLNSQTPAAAESLVNRFYSGRKLLTNYFVELIQMEPLHSIMLHLKGI